MKNTEAGQTEVLLSIHSTQTDPSGEVSRSQNLQRAVCIRSGETYDLYYDQIDEDGEAVSCRMFLSPNRLEVFRSPDLEHQGLRMLPGTEQECVYETGFGSLSMKTRTRSIRIRKIGDKLHASIDYDLLMEGYVLSTVILISIEKIQ